MPATAPALRGVHPRKAFPPPVPRPSLALWPDLAALENDDLAWALFFVCRRVQDVATAPRGSLKPWKRAEEVRNASAAAPEIASELRVLAEELESGLPNSRSAIGKACHALSEWGVATGRGELAVQFAEAAVAVQPASDLRAYQAAKVNRLFGRLTEAEMLYSRAICLARPGKRWWVYVRSHLGIGMIHKARGDVGRARAHYATAAGAAWKLTGERWLAGLTELDLLVLSAEAGEFEAAFEHATRAAILMPKHNERIPALVHDYCLLLVRMRAYSLALPLLECVAEKEMPVPERVIVWSTLARAAAGVGDAERFRLTSRKIEQVEEDLHLSSAVVHVNLAVGAQALGLLSCAEAHARRGVELSTAQGEYGTRKAGEEVLTALQGRQPPLTGVPLESPPAPVCGLAQELATRLHAWRGPTWKRKRQAGAAQIGSV